MDCQFTKDFVALASGYKSLLDDDAKMHELMEQAEEFCMTGEEQVDLAEGFRTLLQDKEKAAESYEKALADIADKGVLLDLARKSARELENVELAKKIYTKAEARMSSASELSGLAQAIISALEDKDYASQVYIRASENLVAPNDLMNLAGDVFAQLEDAALASTVYRKAFDNSSDFRQLLKLVEPVKGNLNDDAFATEILQKAEQSAEASPDLLEISAVILAALDNKAFARSMLEAAEERVTSLGEMKSVVEQVRQHYAEDGDWIARVENKLEKREANQAKYNVFQEREKKAGSVLDFTYIADRVMAELDDRFYARKLFTTAEELFEQGDSDFNQGRLLVLSIDEHLQDQDWTRRLLDAAAEKAGNFAQVLSVATTANNELSNKSFGRDLARHYLQSWEQKLDAGAASSAYDYSKLAKVASRNLRNHTWAARILDKARALTDDHFSFAELGEIAMHMGDASMSESLFRQAVDACNDPSQIMQLASRLTDNGIAADLVKKLYSEAKDKFSDPKDQLNWASGIVQIFKDREWAATEYDELSGAFTDDHEAQRFMESRESNLERAFW